MIVALRPNPPLPISQEDVALIQSVRTALDSGNSSHLRRVEVLIHAQTIRLQGTVSSYYHKQLAQETVKQIVGPCSERILTNELVVPSA